VPHFDAVDRWASFDCYGTLIDWNAGVSAVLGRLWPVHDRVRLLADFHAIEPVVQRDGGLTYRLVLERSLRALAAVRGLPLAETDATALADSLTGWPPFPEAPGALERMRADGWKLAILSNTDPGYLDASIARLGIDVDERVVASAIGSYKPGHRHWEELRRRTGAGDDPARHAVRRPRHHGGVGQPAGGAEHRCPGGRAGRPPRPTRDPRPVGRSVTAARLVGR